MSESSDSPPPNAPDDDEAEEEQLPAEINIPDGIEQREDGDLEGLRPGFVTHQSTSFRYQWAGPLPDPDTLRQYDDVLPGLPERIVTQWEKQTDLRLRNEATVVGSNVKAEARGQWLGFIVFLTGMVGSIVLLAMGMTPAGLVVFVSILTTLVGLFLRGERTSVRELQKRVETLNLEEQADLFDDNPNVLGPGTTEDHSQ